MLRLAWRNLWRQSRRTWLTAGAMAFSNTILVFMMSLQFGMYAMMIDNTLALFTGHLQIQAPGYQDDEKMRQTLADARGLAAEVRSVLPNAGVAARASAFALASSAERSFGVKVLGVEPQAEPGVSTVPGLVSHGQYLDEADPNGIVVGALLANNLKVGLGDEITLLGSGLDGSFAATVGVIRGIIATGLPDLDRGLIQMPLQSFQDVFFMGSAGHEVVVRLAELDAVPAAQASLSQRFAAPGVQVVLDWDTLQPGLRQAIQADLASAWFIYGVLVVLVAFSVLNTVLMSVLERTREFGIVLALGLTPRRIGGLVLLESVLMGVLGMAVGIALGWLVTLWFGYNGFAYPGMDELASKFNVPDRIYPQATWVTLLLGPSVVFAGSVLAAVYPVLKIQLLRPVAAMRAV